MQIKYYVDEDRPVEHDSKYPNLTLTEAVNVAQNWPLYRMLATSSSSLWTSICGSFTQAKTKCTAVQLTHRRQ